MCRAAFSASMRGDSARAWEVCILISLLLHGLALGAPRFMMPPNIVKPPDTSVNIDLDMVATAAPRPETSAPPASPETPRLAEPEKPVEPEPAPKKAEAQKPKPAPKKAEPRKLEQPKKTAAANARPAGQQVASLPGAKADAKSTGAPPTPPAPLGSSSSPRPPYPDLARKRGQEGTVNIRCQVDAQGKVTAVAIAKSSGFKLLDDAALKAVSKWKFRAASKDGASVAGTVVVPVQFKLQ